MGSIRLCLAMLVAAGHLNSLIPGIPNLISGHAVDAVRAFFVLSGYYMARVLADGRYARPRDFYVSRLLKLLPLYWILTGLTFLVDALGAWSPMFELGSKHTVDCGSPLTLAYLLISSITLIGADTWLWLGFDPSAGVWSFAWYEGVTRLWWPHDTTGMITAVNFVAVPQAWTLGVELQFYLLAPLLVRLHSRWLVALIITSVALRLAVDPLIPYNRAMFALEAPFFFVGMLAFRLSLRWTFPAWLSALDNNLGALSYPAYLSHLLVIGIMARLSVFALPLWWESLPITLAVIVLVSLVLDRLIARPIDQLRVRFGARPRRPATPIGIRSDRIISQPP